LDTTTTNAGLVESWQLALHDKSSGTRREYVKALGYFTSWLAANGRSFDLLDVTRQDIEAWFAAMGAAGMSQNTRRSRWVALRSMYNWLEDEEEIDVSPMAKVKVARPNETPPPVVPTDDLKALLRACQGTHFYDRRDMALVRLFLATGARLNEVSMVQVPDVDLQSRIVALHGKGGKDRVARFDAATAAAIDRYKRSRARHRGAATPWLWLGLKGRLTKSGVDAALARRAEAAGLTGFHVHLLRHTWADRWKSRGGSEGDLMRLGGWQDASVMRRYGAARAVDRALNAYDDIDPMEGL
jgi:site-specific recombinase XerD